MMGTLITKVIATNVAVKRMAMEAKVIDVPSSKRVMKKSTEVLSSLFLTYVIEM